MTSGVVWDGHDSALFYFRTSGLARNNNAQLVRLKSDGERSRRALNQLVDQELPGATRFTASMTEALSMQTYPFRATSVIAGFLGRLALVLTLSGLYGVMSYLVTLRTKEIGIGMALGACQSRLRAWRVLTIPPARVQ